MPPEELRTWGHHLVDWVVDYMQHSPPPPVLSQVEPGWVRGKLAPSAPERGEPFADIFSDFESVIMPGITHWNHPAFFGYFAMSGSGPGILGELLTAALNVNAMLWKSSPAATELEEATTAWLGEFLGLPPAFEGTINDTASLSTFHALVAARERHLPEARGPGLSEAPRGRVYGSAEAHSSVTKAVVAMGFGRDGFRIVETDRERAMVPEALARAMDEDRAAGIRPVAVVATIGTTSTAAVDPVARLAEIAGDRGVWLHVDAAYAGPAASLEDQRSAFTGWERADSIVVNPHKWLFTPVDCSVLFARNPEALKAAFSLVPAYLETRTEGVTDLMEYGLALGRRFRALKLWFVMRYFGQEGIRAVLAHHIQLAVGLAARLDETDGWERWTPTRFSLVVLRWSPRGLDPVDRNGANRAIMDGVNRGGTALVSHTELDGDVWLRVALGNMGTGRAEVDGVWAALQQAARDVASGAAA